MKSKREKFVSILTSLEAQQIYDCDYNKTLIKLHGDNSNPNFYNNQLLYKELILVLSEIVPMEQEKAQEEISRYIYDLNFGRHPSSDVKSHNDLYNLLNVGFLVEDAKNQFNDNSVSAMDQLLAKVRSWNILWMNYPGLDKKPKSVAEFSNELEEMFNVTFKSDE